MQIEVGKIYQCESGEIMQLESIVQGGKFRARMRHPLTFRLSEFSIEGEAAKLQPFLEEQKAVEVTEQTYRKVDFKNAQS